MDSSDYSPAPREDPISYPGSRPSSSYLFYNDSIYPIEMIQNKRLKNSQVLLPDGSKSPLNEQLRKSKSSSVDDRYVIIGYGSNANPAQLSLKFKDNNKPIPVIKGIMKGYDVVFAPLVAPYGAIPATIEKAEGTEVEVWISFLDEEQLRIMDESEGRGKSYLLVKINDEVILENGEHIAPVYSYIAINGTLTIDNNPVRFSTIDATNPNYQQMTESEMLKFFQHSYFKSEKQDKFSDFNNLITSDKSYRKQFNEFLKNEHAQNTKIDFEKIKLANFPPRKFADMEISWTLRVKATSVHMQPSADFIAIMRDDDMKEVGVKEDDYILIRNMVMHDIFSWDDIDDESEKKRLIKFLNTLFEDRLKRKNPKVKKRENKITISGSGFEKITISLAQSLEPTVSKAKKQEFSNSSPINDVVDEVKFETINETPKIFPVRKNKQGKLKVTRIRWLETHAHVIGIKHLLSRMKEVDPKQGEIANGLKPGEIAIDQTYREALGLKKGEKVDIKKTNKSYGFKEKLLRTLNYQKALVRVQQNAPFMENKTPVACICEEILSAIGTQYGDIILIESKGRKISVKCAKPSHFMSEFHDSILGKKLSQDQVDKLNKKYENTWIRNPFNLITKWGKVTERYGELIHPIFMDQISRKILNVEPLDPVKIRKSFSWETQKKFNSFGGLAILAVAILVPEIIVIINANNELYWLWFILIPIIGFVIWSVFTSSKYRTNVE